MLVRKRIITRTGAAHTDSRDATASLLPLLLLLAIVRIEVPKMSCPMRLESRTRPAGTLTVPRRRHCSIYLQYSVCVARNLEICYTDNASGPHVVPRI